MRKDRFKQCMFAITFFTMVVATTFSSSAAPAKGKITKVDSTSISGWAWNPDDTNDVQQVELHIFQPGKSEPIQYLHAKADVYREDLAIDLKDGWHGFSVKVDWSKFSGNDFKIKAYTVKDEKFYILGDPVDYSKGASGTAKPAPKTADALTEAAVQVSSPASKEKALGIFTTTGYCNCEKCSGGNRLTYSGAVPQSNHTIAADLSVLPLGSKVRIGSIIYTVEDIGSAVKGNIIDIYYDSHEKALSHGLAKQEVFLVQ